MNGAHNEKKVIYYQVEISSNIRNGGTFSYTLSISCSTLCFPAPRTQLLEAQSTTERKEIHLEEKNKANNWNKL